MDRIKVLLVEDDLIWREGLSEYMERQHDLFLVGAAATKEDAVELTRLLEIDVILMDIVLTENNFDGLDAAIEISTMNKSKIIMLTSLSVEEVILDAFTIGALNYITKANFKDIPDAIRAAYYNHSSIHSDAAEILRNGYVRMKKEEYRKVLTPSEKAVLKLIDQGHTQCQIQNILRITVSTIKKHVNKILKKLGMKTSKEAADKANKHGFF
jgi:two-component system response regulator DevR